MTDSIPTGSNGKADDEAAAWLARLRAPGGRCEQAAFEAWFMADSRNTDAYERLLATWDKLDVARSTPIAKRRRSFFASTIAAPRRRRTLAAVALATALISIGIGIASLGLGPSPVISSAYASAVGQIRTVALTDGSHVTLDTDSALRTAFTDQERRVRLIRGRARFRVVSDRRPFIVDAGAKLVRATATDFDIDLAEGKMAVAVLSGTVEIDSRAPSQSAAALDLGSRQAIAFTAQGTAGQVAPIASSETGWPTGMLTFEDASLAEVVDRANLYATNKIVLAGADTGKLRFTGTFRSTDTVALARMVATMFRLKLSHGASGTIVLGLAVDSSARK